MTLHFAYPNVLPREKKFIGCGRYALCDPRVSPRSGFVEVQGVPNTPNRIILNRVAQLLAPQSYDANLVLFHKQDQEQVQYQGDSLDLAWLLSHVHRSADIRFSKDSDIWCSGVIQLDGSGPYLLDVEQNGFYLKLKAFLEISNNDQIFIVPLPNLTQQAREMCKRQKTRICRINDDFGKSKISFGIEKVIITVAADELPKLLETLFVLPDRNVNHLQLWKVLLFVLLMAGVSTAVILLTRLHQEPSTTVESSGIREPIMKEGKVLFDVGDLHEGKTGTLSPPSPEAIQSEDDPPQTRPLQHITQLLESVPNCLTKKRENIVKSERLNIPIGQQLEARSDISHYKKGEAVPQRKPSLRSDRSRKKLPQAFEGMEETSVSEEKKQQFFRDIIKPHEQAVSKTSGLGRKLTDEEW